MRLLPHNLEERLHTFAVLVALVGVAGIVLFFVLGSGVTAPRTPGIVQTTEIKVAPEISGRLARLAVAQGQSVRQGDDLVELLNPELSASLILAKAQAGEARAARDRVYAGSAPSRSPFSNARSKPPARICSMPSSSLRGSRGSPRTASPRARSLTRLPLPSVSHAQDSPQHRKPTRRLISDRPARSLQSPTPKSPTRRHMSRSSPPVSRNCGSERRWMAPWR